MKHSTFGKAHLNHLAKGTLAIAQEPIIQPSRGETRFVKLSPIW